MTVCVEEAQLSLKQLIAQTIHGEQVLITDGQMPVAELVPVQTTGQHQPVFGSCKGMLTIISDDDDHLADFQE